MKRLFIQCLFVVVAIPSFAQFDPAKLSFGLRLGPSATWLLGDDENDESVTNGSIVKTSTTSKRYGIYGGGYAQYPLSNRFTLRAELMLSFNGSRNKSVESDKIYSSTSDLKFNINYLQIPLLLSYSFVKNSTLAPYIVTGFVPAFMISNSITNVTTNIDIRDKTTETKTQTASGGIKTTNMGYLIGFGIREFPSVKRLGIEIRWNLGLSNIYKTNRAYVTNGSFSITAHYLIGGLAASKPVSTYQRYKRVGGKQ